MQLFSGTDSIYLGLYLFGIIVLVILTIIEFKRKKDE